MLPQVTVRQPVRQLVVLAAMSMSAVVLAETPLQQLLAKGQFDEAEQQLTATLEAKVTPLQQTQLGFVQAMSAVQGLADDSHRYGLYSQQWLGSPLLRLPVENNREPDEMSYDDFRMMVATFRERLIVAEETLGDVEPSNDKWTVELATVGLDLNRDDVIGHTKESEGASGTREDIYAVLRRIQQPPFRRGNEAAELPDTRITFDYADTLWLQGYCNFLIATSEMVLAYDERELFELCGHIVFRGAETRYQFLSPGVNGDLWAQIPDLIAAVHLIDFKLVDAELMKSAHARLLNTVQLSRKSWQAVLDETDDEREWIAGPDQVLAIPSLGFSITREQAEQWPAVLAETEAILKGDKLLPLWRPRDENHGINVRRVFNEPRDFDLVLWVQQSAAMPFVEEGKVTDMTTWRDFQRTFGGNLLGVSFWLN